MGDAEANQENENRVEMTDRPEVLKPADRIAQWKEMIASVEKETEDLEDQLRELGDKTCIVNKAECQELLNQCVASVTGSNNMKHEAQRLQMEISNLDDLLDLNKNLTNIDMTRITSHLLEKDDSTKHRQHIVEGTCGQLSFTLKYTVTESMDSERMSARVKDLKIDVDVETVGKLYHVIERLEQSNDIQGFFVFLQSFVNAMEIRHDLFKDVRSNFKPSVEISTKGGNPHLVIRSKENPGESWEIYWELEVTSLCRTLPKIYLKVDLPENSGPEAKQVAETLPETFQDLMKENGIESAIQDIIHLVIEHQG